MEPRCRVMMMMVMMMICQSLAIYAASDAAGFEDEKSFFHYPFAPVPPISTFPPIVSTPPPVVTTHPPAVTYPPRVNPPKSVGGGSHGTPKPSYKPPSGCGTPPPVHKSGTYHHPVTPITVTPPPSTYHAPPTTPIVTPGTPPPFGFDPHSPPFPCIFWRNHPTLVWGLLGWWGTLGNAFGISSVPGFGPRANVLQALSNTREDGYGELYREGTAALLNAVARTRFPYSVNEVRDGFVAALASEKEAGAQAQLFKLANEGRNNNKD